MSLAYVRSPYLIVLQRRLFAPTYIGPGKWVIYDTSTRRSHLAVRNANDAQTKDIPRVMKCLIDERSGSDHLPDTVIDQLVRAGLMVQGETQPSRDRVDNFLSRFQQVVYDYPFVDYSSPQAFQFDRALMAEYADESEMPSVWTKRTGTPIALPEVSWADLESRGRDEEFNLKSLSAVLRFSFGQIGSFRVPGGERVRKANPSGGAKHPTEAWLEVGKAWGDLQRGMYAYDAQNHALVQTDMPISGRTGLNLSVRSRLERAMWRYRDPRSSRAVLFDAGHVIENVLIVLCLFGTDAILRSGRLLRDFSPDDLREPELGSIDILLDSDPPRKFDLDHVGNGLNAVETDPSESHVLNPLVYFTLKNGGLVANMAYPENRRVDINPVEFSILTHCIPSSRGEPCRPGDRYTTTKDILDAVPGSSEADIERLEKNDLLLGRMRGKVLWPEVRRWAEKGWYLPLLAWAEASNSAGHAFRGERESNNGNSMSGFSNVATPLRERVTTRSFSDQQIAVERLRSIIADSLNVESDISVASLFVAPLKISGLTREIVHHWDAASNDFVSVGRSVTPDDIVRVTIGQGWVRNCAAMIWLLSKVDVNSPENYVSPHILLGRIAQRLALLSTADELGVFQTPATLDRDLANLLGQETTPESLIYTVAIGATSRKAVE